MNLFELKEGEPERPVRSLDQLGLSKNKNVSCLKESVQGVERAEVFHNVFSTDECSSLIECLNQEQRWKCADGTSTSGLLTYRVSDRMMFLSDELSNEIVSRTGMFNTKGGLEANLKTMKVRKHSDLPCSNIADNYIQSDVGNEGDWNCVSINPCFRALRYRKGGHFLPHSDGSTVLGEEKSFATVIIYLNDGFNGGSTKMFMDDMEAGAEEARCEVAKIVPQPGKCLVFYHDIVHSGEKVSPVAENTGVGEEECFKYILRTELMYRRAEPPLSKEGGDEASSVIVTYSPEGVQLLRDAEKLESDGNFQEAIQLYNKLRYKYPDIAEAAGI